MKIFKQLLFLREKESQDGPYNNSINIEEEKYEIDAFRKRYTLVKEVGWGGFGKAYLAVDNINKFEYAFTVFLNCF